MRISSKNTNETRKMFDVKYIRIYLNTFWSHVFAENSNEIHLSRKFELWEMLSRLKEKNSVVHVNTTYK